jgi:hypothetical protein
LVIGGVLVACGVLLANVVGTTSRLRLPAPAFRAVDLMLAFVAGITTMRQPRR